MIRNEQPIMVLFRVPPGVRAKAMALQLVQSLVVRRARHAILDISDAVRDRRSCRTLMSAMSNDTAVGPVNPPIAEGSARRTETVCTRVAPPISETTHHVPTVCGRPQGVAPWCRL
jgi:hypothetical protein